MFLLLCQKLVGRLQKIFNGIALNLLVKYLNSVEYSNPSTWYICFSLSCVRLFATPWTVAYQAPPSMGFSRQEHWSGLPLPSPSRNPTHYILTVYNNDGAKSLLILKYRTPPPQNHFIILESKYPRGYNNAFKMAGIKFPTYPDMLQL